MPIIAKNNPGVDFPKVPPGAHFAICVMIADLGMQPSARGKKDSHKVYIQFEIPDEIAVYKNKDGEEVRRIQTLGTFYTLSLSEKAFLRRDLENWRGQPFTAAELEGFDISKLLGKCCQIMVTHKKDGTKDYVNITGLMATAKDQKERARNAVPSNRPILCEGPHDPNFEFLPEFLQNKILEQVKPAEEPDQVPEGLAQLNSRDDFDDDIPF